MAFHYKKDGSLDMRYSTSRAAMSSGSGMSSFGYSGAASYSPMSHASSSSSGLHYKKDGSLDMRYNSSRAAAPSSFSSRPPSSSELHYKKDGSLDLRYSSSRTVAPSSFSGRPPSSSELHYKKDGSLDMRYSSSKTAMDNHRSTGAYSQHGIPKNIPVTKAGIPDMRTSAAKEWVKQQAQNGTQDIPSWIPRTKDGSLDVSKPIAQEYMKWKDTASTEYNPDQRLAYYMEKLEDMLFRAQVENARNDSVETPQYEMLPETQDIQREFSNSSNRYSDKRNSSYSINYNGRGLSNSASNDKPDHEYDIQSQISEAVETIDYKDLKINPDAKLGQGAFGIVYKAIWKGQIVAVKQLHLNKLTRQEKKSFVKEINIMSTLGEHPNLVYLHGYTLEPPCLVMEYVELGSLSHLLHYCEDATIEAKITDGRIKKRLILGTALGMAQLHAVNIVHGDLKPQNVLVSETYTAKVTDFGLSTLRGKTSSSVASSITSDDGAVACGTAGYMAPELLGSSSPPEYSSDVYSFGVLLNEVIQEEEPYADQFQNFLGRGPFGAANHARLGNRPRIGSRTAPILKKLIERCWHSDPRNRPSFQQIFNELKPTNVQFPNSFDL